MTLLQHDDIEIRSPAFHDRREFGRRATFKRAKICFPADIEHDCIVIDLSDGGARVRLLGTVEPPATFDLKIPGDDFIVTCEVAHRTDQSVGVKFVRSPRRLSWQKSSGQGGLTAAPASGKSER
jgi:hypothetical protein